MSTSDLADFDFGGLSDTVSALHQYLAAVNASSTRARVLPINSTQAAADASGNAVLAFDACPYGSQWTLRRLTIGGQAWGTTAAGTAVFAVTTYVPESPDAVIPLGQVVGSAPTLPNVQYFGGKRIVITSSQQLVVFITGGTSAQTYQASALLEIFPM